MGSVDLEIGDIVEYTGEYYMFSRWLLGTKGQVQELYQDGREREWCAIVVWDDHELNTGVCRYCHKKGPDNHCGHPTHGGTGVFAGNVKKVVLTPQWEL